MHLNHPETTPPTLQALVHGKIVFHENGVWCQKGWGPLPYADGDSLCCCQSEGLHCSSCVDTSPLSSLQTSPLSCF